MKTQKKRNYSPLPKKAAQFHFIHQLVRSVVPKNVRKATEKTFFYISYEVPFPISSLFKRTQISKAFWSAFLITIAFAFFGQFFATILSDTHIGSEVGKVYFLTDYPNLANWLFVCPTYVGLSTIFMLTLLNLRSGINKLLYDLGEEDSSISTGVIPAWLLICFTLFIPSIGIPNYISEALDPEVFKLEYWFLSIDSSGERHLNIAGIYYTIVNFMLQLVSVLGIVSFAYMISYTGQLSALIEHRNLKNELDFGILKKNLQQFVYAYVIAKSLVAIYMVNIVYTWPIANPSASNNYLIAVVIILIVGLIIVPFPRYIIQKQWYDFATRRADAELDEYPSYQDLRNESIQGFSFFLDIFRQFEK